MAETGNDTGAELKAHQETFAGFTAMMTWGTVASFAVGALVIFLIAK